MPGGRDGVPSDDETLLVRMGARHARVPVAEIDEIVPLRSFRGDRAHGTLAVLRDGSARLLARGEATDVALIGRTEPPSPAPASPPGAVSSFPIVESAVVGAGLVLAATAVVEIVALVVLADVAQGRFELSRAHAVLLAGVLAGALFAGVLLRREVDANHVTVRAEGLDVRVTRDRGVIAWSRIDRVVWYPRTKRDAQLALVSGPQAFLLPLPKIVSRVTMHDWARTLAAELESARQGAFAPPRPRRGPHRGLAVACLVASAVPFAMAVAGELAMADRAMAIRARAEHVEAHVVADDALDKGRFVRFRVAGRPELQSAWVVDDDAFVVVDGSTVVERDPVTGMVWLDAQVRWPPGARDEHLEPLVGLTLWWLGGPLLITAAYVLSRDVSGRGR